MTAAVLLGIAAAVAVVTFRGSQHPEGQGTAARTATVASARPRRSPDGAVDATAHPSTAAPAATSEPRPRAAGAVAILAAAVRAEAVVAGVVMDVAKVDVHGWRADLRVDRVLRGDARLGDTLTVAWEELATQRRVRFADGDRVLVVLDPLPTQSLWRKRFPLRDRTQPVLVVASAGDAFVVRPDGGTLDALEHYLAMTATARDGAPGSERLAELVRGGHPALAREALTLLENETARADQLGAEGAAALLAAARSAERDAAIRARALELAARHRLPGTRETALALAEPGSPIRADAYRALAALPGGLSADVVERLLPDPDPSVRVVGVESLRGDAASERLARIVRDDPAPAVRLAAGRALLAREGTGAVATVVPLLDDDDASVRSEIAESFGSVGAPAIAPLLAVVNQGSDRAALAAILAISRTGPKAGVTLETIADTHPKEAIRAFAKLALGKAPDQPY